MTHAVAGAAIAQALAPLTLRRTWTWIAAFTAMLPDADVAGFPLGVPYGHVVGHRGITHSLPFAALAAAGVLASFWRKIDSRQRGPLALCMFLAAASHGFLDAFTNGGMGVAFFAPFDTSRYFFPVTPIPVSPLGGNFFSQRGAEVFVAELAWVWIPAIAVILRARRRQAKYNS
jgi:inner membrane protein